MISTHSPPPAALRHTAQERPCCGGLVTYFWGSSGHQTTGYCFELRKHKHRNKVSKSLSKSPGVNIMLMHVRTSKQDTRTTFSFPENFPWSFPLTTLFLRLLIYVDFAIHQFLPFLDLFTTHRFFSFINPLPNQLSVQGRPRKEPAATLILPIRRFFHDELQDPDLPLQMHTSSAR